MKKRKRIASQRTKVNGETYISSARVEMVVTEIRNSAPCQLFVSMFSGMDCEHTHTRKHYIQFQQFHNFAAIGIASVAQCEQTAAAAQKIGENGNKKKLKFVPSSVRYHYSQSGASIEQFRFFFFVFQFGVSVREGRCSPLLFLVAHLFPIPFHRWVLAVAYVPRYQLQVPGPGIAQAVG